MKPATNGRASLSVLQPAGRAAERDRSEVIVSVIVLIFFGSPILIMFGWSLRGWAIAKGLVP